MQRKSMIYNKSIKMFRIIEPYICSDLKNKTMFEFIDHGWKRYLYFADFVVSYTEYFKRNNRNIDLSDDMINDYVKSVYDPNFMFKLNSKPNLFCFTNGVFDCYTEIFRKGRPDDYLSGNLGYAYKVNDKNRKEVHADLLRTCQEKLMY